MASCLAFSPQSTLVGSLEILNTILRVNSYMALQPTNEDVLRKPLWMLTSLLLCITDKAKPNVQKAPQVAIF